MRLVGGEIEIVQVYDSAGSPGFLFRTLRRDVERLITNTFFNFFLQFILYYTLRSLLGTITSVNESDCNSLLLVVARGEPRR